MIAIPFVKYRARLDELFLGKYFIEIVVVFLLINILLMGSSRRDKENTYNNGNKYNIKTFSFLLIIYMVYTFVSLLVGSFTLGSGFPFDAGDERFGTWVNHITIFLMFFMSYHLIDPDKDFYYVLGIISLLIFAFAFRFRSEFVHVQQFHFTYKSRVGGMLSNLGPNEVAAFFASYTMLCVGMVFKEKRKPVAALLLMVIIAGTYGVIYSYSRGAYVAYFAGIILALWLNRKILLVVVAVALIFWKSILPVSVVDRIMMTTEAGKHSSEIGIESGDVAGRAKVGLAGWVIFKENPVIGTGFLTVWRLSTEKMDTHNVYIKYLAETGVVGAILLVMIFGYMIKTAFRLYRYSPDDRWRGFAGGFLCLMLVVIVGNFFGDRWTYMALSSNYLMLSGMISRKLTLMDS
jgi:O-antigen ligase